MAHIDDLVKQVSDPQLRAALMQQVSTLTSRKQFGLVFQEHTPESVRLPQQRVRTGDKVELRESKESSTYHVLSTKASLDVATIVELDESGESTGEPQDMLKADLVVIKPFGDPVYPGLRQVGEAGSANSGQPTHVVINGENFHALQALEYTHAGKVDIIYIDPPYNTGNDSWKYNDRYIDGQDSYRHSKWLSFMEKRLRIAKSLLKDTGVLFMSIDDSEQARLKMLADQVFGETNFISTVSRVAKTTSNKGNQFAPSVDYVLCYAANIAKIGQFSTPLDEEYMKKFKDQDDHDWYTTVGLYQSSLDSRPNQRYWVECPDGSFCIPPGTIFPELVSDGSKVKPLSNKDKVWRWADSSYFEKRYNLVFKQTKTSPLIDEHGNQSKWNVYTKQYLAESIQGGVRPRNFIADFQNTQGTKELKKIGVDFNFAKPVNLIKWLIQIADMGKDAVVVDFFGGSGTTIDAVIQLNNEDGGNRQGVLVTNNELSKAEDSSLRKGGFRPGDTEYEAAGVFNSVTMPRITTVLTGVREDGSKYSDGIEGQSAAFFDLTYEDENLVSLGNRFEAIAPLLWMQSGATGEMIAKRSDIAKGEDGYSVPVDGNYAVIFDTESAADAIEALHDGTKKVFIVTDSENDFKAVTANLPGNLRNNAQRLYSSYLRSFEINRG